MRRIFILAASLAMTGAFGLGTFTASAQDAPTPQPPAAAGEATPQIQRVHVVDVSELPQDTQKQVEQVVAKAGEENLRQLRSSVEATPAAKAALEEKGASSAQVVATSMGTDGTLTLITKKNS